MSRLRGESQENVDLDGGPPMFGCLGEVLNQVRMEPVDVIDVDAERVISVIRLKALSERFGTEIDAEWVWLIKARDGKGIEAWTCTDRAQALETAGLVGEAWQVLPGPPGGRSHAIKRALRRLVWEGEVVDPRVAAARLAGWD